MSQTVLKLSQNNYVAMQDIEFTNKWLEFVKDNDSHICIYEVYLDSSKAKSGPIITHKIQHANRSKEVLKTNLKQIITSIVDAIEKYMIDALSINPLFRDTSRINSLIELKSKLINLNS